MPPAYSILTDSMAKFVLGFGLGGVAVWKMSSLVGGNNHDHEMMGNGSKAPEQAQRAEALLRRHSTHTNIKQLGGESHPEAVALKQAA